MNTRMCLVFGWLILTTAMVGCATPTYINIPPENGDWAFSNPNAGDVREIQVLAIRRALEAEPLGGPYEIHLPARTTAETYAVIAYQLGADALVPAHVPAVALDLDGKPLKKKYHHTTPPAPADVSLGEFPAVVVKSIRIRSADGQVDLVRPSASGRRLTTVYLKWEGGYGWSADRVRAWRVDPDAQPMPVGPTPPSELRRHRSAD